MKPDMTFISTKLIRRVPLLRRVILCSGYTYFAIFLIITFSLALIYLPHIQYESSNTTNKRTHSRHRPNYPRMEEMMPEDEKPFRWMELLEGKEKPSISKQPQYRNLTNLLKHKLFLLNLSRKNSADKNVTKKNLPISNMKKLNPAVENFYREISSDSLYPVDSQWIGWIKSLLKSNRIMYAENKPGGSQLKLSIKLESDILGILKPMRVTRDQETFPDHFYFVDLERHNAEIASFYLDQLLDFRRAPPVVGRWVNVTELSTVSDNRLSRTFFKSPAKNTCFHGTCDYYCRTETPVCGHPHMIEVSIAMYLPDSRMFPRSINVHPYRRSYTKSNQESWIKDSDYCQNNVMTDPVFAGTNNRRIFQITDMAIFDFLIGNMDRHHYECFDDLGDDSFILHLDQGKAFGKHSTDELSILAPLKQCCKVSWKTWTILKHIEKSNDGKLGDLLYDSLEDDMLSPLLAEQYYNALDRRLDLVLKAIETCLVEKHPKNVFDQTYNSTQ